MYVAILVMEPPASGCRHNSCRWPCTFTSLDELALSQSHPRLPAGHQPAVLRAS